MLLISGGTMHNFRRPVTATVKAERLSVAGSCTECGKQSLESYRVMSEGGWWLVVKCQNCLASVSREPGPLFGPLIPLGSTI